MKLIITIFLFVVISNSCSKEPIGGEQEHVFLKFYGTSKTTEGFDIKQLPDGSYIALGTTVSDEKGTDMYLVKTDIFGNEQWHLTIGGKANETGSSLQVLSDGNFILTGSSVENSKSTIYLVKVAANGDTLWTRNIGGSTNLVGNNIHVALSGGFVIAGSIMIANDGFTNALLLYTDMAGNELWRKSFGNVTGNETAYFVSEMNDYFVLTGRSESKPVKGVSDGFVVLFRKDKGSLQPSVTDDFGSIGEDYGQSLQQLSNGSFICTGSFATTDSGTNAYLLKFKIDPDKGIVQEWFKTFGSTFDDWGMDIEVVTDNEFAVVGTTSRSDGSKDLLFFKTDGSGNLLNDLITYGETGNQSGKAISKTSDGGFIITGTNEYSGYSVLTLLKTNNNGKLY